MGTMTARHAYGLLPDRHDDRDLRFSRVINRVGLSQMAPWVDLRAAGKISPVYDQGDLGSCTGFGIFKGFREALELKAGHPLTPLSALWGYYEERAREGTVTEDAGASIRDGMRVLRKLGAAPDADWPYDPALFATPPPLIATADAIPFTIAEFHRVHTVVEAKLALTMGLTVVIGFDVYESFESKAVARTGMVPVPNIMKEAWLGGHCTLLTGYSDVPGACRIPVGCFGAKNSWGLGWGDGGFCYLPYGFFAQELGIVSDQWTGEV